MTVTATALATAVISLQLFARLPGHASRKMQTIEGGRLHLEYSGQVFFSFLKPWPELPRAGTLSSIHLRGAGS